MFMTDYLLLSLVHGMVLNKSSIFWWMIKLKKIIFKFDSNNTLKKIDLFATIMLVDFRQL